MTQKEQIANLEQRVQALEQKLAKLVRSERSQQSSSDAKPLPNRRQERLAKFNIEKAWPIDSKEGGESERVD